MLIPVDACKSRRIRETLHKHAPELDHHRLSRDACICRLKAMNINLIEVDETPPLPSPRNTATRSFNIERIPDSSYSEQLAHERGVDRSIGTRTIVERSTREVVDSIAPAYVIPADAVYSNLTVSNQLSTT